MQPVLRREGDGEIIQGPAGGPLTLKLRGAESAGTLTVLENVIAPGEGPPLHTHDREGESWQVLEGDLRFRLADAIERAPAGTFVHVPAGVPHCFQNVGSTTARLLVIFSPAGMEAFFERFAQLPPGPVDPSAFEQLGREVGMTVVGPPLAVSHPLEGHTS